VVTGYAGQVSLAQLSLAGVGAFALFRFAENWGVPFPIAPILSAAVAAVIGVVIGLPALRIRGLPVAIVTLAFATAVEALWFNNPDYNGGLTGATIKVPSLFGVDFRVDALSSRIPFALMCLTTLTMVAVGVALLRRSQLGASMLAVKANERSAAAAGIDVARTKVIAFAMGAFIAGLAGSLLGYYQQAAIATTYNAVAGIGIFALIYLSGVTTISGGINAGVLAAGGLVYVVIDRNLDLGPWYAAISGVLLIFTVIRNPEGIMGDVQARLRERRERGQQTTLPVFEREEGATVTPSVGGNDSSAACVLKAEAITVNYGGVRAVDNVNLDIREGSIVGLIGPNGAGKTTLIDAISGFTKGLGTTTYLDVDVSEWSPHRRARMGLGRTFQSVELYEDLTVAENIVVGQRAARERFERHEDHGAALDELCVLLRLDGVRDRPVAELSAGYRQLVSIARTLAGRPRVLLLDEPAGGLDSDESRWLGDRLCDIRDAGVTVVMIDHDMDLVLNVCDYVYVLDIGAVIAQGAASEVRADRRVAEAYLGMSDTALAVGQP
ncbi:MAG: branched-chain amino acid ABC transporter ATP-binding protein/permease, partial [Rhodococcus fascians]